MHLRWEWLKRRDDTRTWKGLNMSPHPQVQEAFDSLVRWQVGTGDRILFWRDRWINGARLAEITPIVVVHVRTQVISRRSVKEGLYLHSWASDIGELSTDGVVQFIWLWEILLPMQISPDQEDVAIWKWNVQGQYTSASTYHMLWEGAIRFQCASIV